MKTRLRFPLLLALFVAAFSSCTEDNAAKPEESPFFTFFDVPAITIDTTPVAATLWEYGFEFSPVVDGRITKFGVKLPTTGPCVVRLWRLYGSGAPTVIKEQAVIVGTAHEPTFVEINPLSVDANAPLGITVWANSFYRIEKQDASEFTFPIKVGNIEIAAFKEAPNNSGMAMFPATKNSTTVAPCVNVVFVAD